MDEETKANMLNNWLKVTQLNGVEAPPSLWSCYSAFLLRPLWLGFQSCHQKSSSRPLFTVKETEDQQGEIICPLLLGSLTSESELELRPPDCCSACLVMLLDRCQNIIKILIKKSKALLKMLFIFFCQFLLWKCSKLIEIVQWPQYTPHPESTVIKPLPHLLHLTLWAARHS